MTKSALKPILRIALTAGEPAGIGPDLVIQLAQQQRLVELVVIADPNLLLQRAEILGLPLHLSTVSLNQEPQPHSAGHLSIFPVSLQASVHCGALDPANAAYVLETLRLAGKGCLQKSFDAVVTAPVHKGIINQSGISFLGHTEFFADLTQASHVVMMLVTEQLRVALVTTHLPLAQVPQVITAERIKQTLQIIDHDLKHMFQITKPQILVCGLNPHAGEGGHLGCEEIEIITPTLELLRQQGMNVHGPLPADTIFTPKYLQQADVIVAMYHDQGLPVLKHQGFGGAVNVTLGLPIIRTSVDHGTALDLAGTGKADVGSLQAALSMAIDLASKKGRN